MPHHNDFCSAICIQYIQAHCPSCVNNACFVFFHYAVNLTHNSTLIFYLSIKTTASSHLCDCMYYFKQSNYYNFHSNYYNFHRPSQYLPVNISYPAFITWSITTHHHHHAAPGLAHTSLQISSAFSMLNRAWIMARITCVTRCSHSLRLYP